MNHEEKANCKILVLEDEKDIAQNTKEMLEELGYKVTGIADSYDVAIKSAEQDFPHVALCDIKIKGYKDGVEVAKKLQQMGDVAIVFLTAHYEADIKNRALDVDPQGYLLKPALNDISLDIHIQIATRNVKAKVEDKTKIANGKYYAWDRGIYHVIKIKDILYVKANNNNALIYTNQRIIDVNQKFGKVLDDLASHNITQVSRSYAINLDQVISFGNNMVFVELDEDDVADKVKRDEGWSRTIDVSKAHRDKLKAHLNIG